MNLSPNYRTLRNCSSDGGLPQDRSQRSCVQLGVVGNDDLRMGILTPQNDVAAVLSFELES